MAKRIHFEDDIFYLTVGIRMAQDALALDVDADLFLEKTLGDLEFYGATLAALLDALVANERILEREEQLANLSDAEDRYAVLLRDVRGGRGSLGTAFAPLEPRIAELEYASKERRGRMDALSASVRGEASDPLVVSSEELNELLKGME